MTPLALAEPLVGRASGGAGRLRKRERGAAALAPPPCAAGVDISARARVEDERR